MPQTLNTMMVHTKIQMYSLASRGGVPGPYVQYGKLENVQLLQSLDSQFECCYTNLTEIEIQK